MVFAARTAFPSSAERGKLALARVEDTGMTHTATGFTVIAFTVV